MIEMGKLAEDGSIVMKPIGWVCSAVAEQQFGGFTGLVSRIELKPEFKDYLLGLDEYSHLKVIYWLSEMTETHAIHQPQGNPEAPYVGMFACR
jgi:tRNA (Thr-GGU) A37 N-methylase